MKIAFFSGDITRCGGTERVATTIVPALLNREKYSIIFISLTEASRRPFFEIDDSIERFVLSKKWINPGAGYLPIIIKLIRCIRKSQIDVLIDIDGVLDILSLPAKLFTGVRVVSWEHFNFYENLGTPYRIWIRRFSAWFSDCIVTLTDADRNCYQKVLKTHHEIRVIHNPVGYMNEIPRMYPRHIDKFTILSVGNLVVQKGFDYIPEIGLILSKKYPLLEWEWLIVGEGIERTSIQDKINAAGLEKKIILKGLSSNMKEYYQNADLYVMTSRTEGLPMVLLEAKMYHLPIISFDIHMGLREIIHPSKNGFLLPPPIGNGAKELTAMADHIEILATNEALYHQFADHSLEHMESFQLDYIADCWCDLLDRLI
ncbi:MAG: glycosyltransferase family 1 [Herbinix sp.]|jgi:glycosyltransferase involved in cell wall biosynthesis|nr:glycosyltransferase family 1 [Herbinix sp.]